MRVLSPHALDHHVIPPAAPKPASAIPQVNDEEDGDLQSPGNWIMIGVLLAIDILAFVLLWLKLR